MENLAQRDEWEPHYYYMYVVFNLVDTFARRHPSCAKQLLQY